MVLNKIIAQDVAATAPFEFEVPKTFNFNYFTVEIVFSGLTYTVPNANDAEIRIEDGEIDPDSGSVTDYEVVNGGLVRLAQGQTRSKLRVVDLATQNVKVVYAQGTASAGTIEEITITFKK